MTWWLTRWPTWFPTQKKWKVADMELDMVANMEVDKVADMVADMEADKVVDMAADIFKTKY